MDALRDLDDALSLLFLFANLPSTSTVPPKTISLCQRLCLEFQHYLIITHSLQKSFLSIKGIYYQATIQGQDILWLAPYKFVQRVTGDVDFRIMGTFVEFYTTLLGFVNFRLYTTIGLIYPPRFDSLSDEKGGELSAIALEASGIEEAQKSQSVQQLVVDGEANSKVDHKILNDDVQKQIAAIEEHPNAEQHIAQEQGQHGASDQDVSDAVDAFEITGDDADVLPQPQASSNEAGSLFAPFTFFLSRETPRQPLEFILRAFGCKRIGWDAVLGDGAFTNNETDPIITHQIVDRPPVASLPEEPQVSGDPSDPASAVAVRPGYRVPGRTYVQPQWVWDCINEVKLLRPDLYAPGATLPPHLSPWVKPTKGAYDPSAPLAEQEREGEAEEAEQLSDDDEDVEEAQAENGAESADDNDDATAENRVKSPHLASTPAATDPDNDHGMTIADDNDSDSSSSSSAASTASFAGFSSAPESSPEPTLTQHQLELEAEAAGLTFSERATATRKANGGPVKGILKSNNDNGAAADDDVDDNDEAARMKEKKEKMKMKKRKEREEEEELERRKMMMGRKKRKVFEKMVYSNRLKEAEAEALRAKRRKIEARKAKV